MKQNQNDSSMYAHAGAIAWNYDRVEVIADLIVHVVGVSFGAVASIMLLASAAAYATAPDLAAASVYAGGLLCMLVLSAAYNLWPVSRTKWLLRRFDHSAIYLLIAATYTPFAIQAKQCPLALPLLIAVWCVAAIGTAVKITLPGRFDRVSIAVYLAMGWSAAVLCDSVAADLPAAALQLMIAGGIVYSLGVVFHTWERLRFQNAIWHCFVLLGTACHYGAVLNLVLT